MSDETEGRRQLLARWHIYCDESGDRGLPIKPGASLAYVVTVVLVEVGALQSVHNHLSGRVREWKRLSSSEKQDDRALSSFLNSLQPLVGKGMLCTTVIANKLETTSPKLTNPRGSFLIGYTYGLAFKRILPFLTKHGHVAEIYIDRNSSNEVQSNLSYYLSQVLPRKHASRMQSMFGIASGIPYGKPVFVDCKQNPIHRLADFIAGYTRAAFEAYLRDNRANVAYPYSWQSLRELHRVTLTSWRWEGLLYHPYGSRIQHIRML